jgi:hypothetical protein
VEIQEKVAHKNLTFLFLWQNAKKGAKVIRLQIPRNGRPDLEKIAL